MSTAAFPETTSPDVESPKTGIWAAIAIAAVGLVAAFWVVGNAGHTGTAYEVGNYLSGYGNPESVSVPATSDYLSGR